MVKIEYHGEYPRDLEKILSEIPDLLQAIDRKIKLFQNNHNDSRLDNHPLTKRMEGKYAFSIDDDIRVIYDWIGKSSVRFLAIGRHEKVYPKQN